MTCRAVDRHELVDLLTGLESNVEGVSDGLVVEHYRSLAPGCCAQLWRVSGCDFTTNRFGRIKRRFAADSFKEYSSRLSLWACSVVFVLHRNLLHSVIQSTGSLPCDAGSADAIDY